jgi:acylphosphatase
MKKSFILSIQGKVQGVGFRYFLKQKADLLQISGFAKNRPDGTVYVEAEGDSEQLELFIHFCQKGPSYAWVEKTEFQWCPLQNFNGFNIK